MRRRKLLRTSKSRGQIDRELAERQAMFDVSQSDREARFGVQQGSRGRRFDIGQQEAESDHDVERRRDTIERNRKIAMRVQEATRDYNKKSMELLQKINEKLHEGGYISPSEPEFPHQEQPAEP